jgi:hypothetical protein
VLTVSHHTAVVRRFHTCTRSHRNTTGTTDHQRSTVDAVQRQQQVRYQEFIDVPCRCGNCNFSQKLYCASFTVPHHHLTTTPNLPRVTTSVACPRAGTAMPRLPLLTPLKLGSSESLPSSSLLQPSRCRRLCPLLGTATEPVTTTLHRRNNRQHHGQCERETRRKGLEEFCVHRTQVTSATNFDSRITECRPFS